MKKLSLQCYTGSALKPYLPELAKLRIDVFKDYPYLYQGNLAYEETYLQAYFQCPDAMMVLASDNQQIVGASTAIPLAFETAECQKPFIEQAIPLADVFYFGESVLLAPYRGQGVYRHFFEAREAAAKAYGCKIAAFCAVERAADDPRKPMDYTSLEAIWQHFGYVKRPDLCAYYEWTDIGEITASAKPLIFWLKTV